MLASKPESAVHARLAVFHALGALMGNRLTDGIEQADRAMELAQRHHDADANIQRRLARHRREHGFAPTIRIGLHATEAKREGGDYLGRGDHVAARVAAAVGGEEILVSDATMAEIGSMRFGLSDPRQLNLKGVEEPVEVRSLTWR